MKISEVVYDGVVIQFQDCGHDAPVIVEKDTYSYYNQVLNERIMYDQTYKVICSACGRVLPIVDIRR